MAAGVPVLTSRTAEDQFLVSENGCGLVVDYPFDIDAVAEQVATLLKDESRRRDYGLRGLEAVRDRYNWQAFETGFTELFDHQAPGAAVR